MTTTYLLGANVPGYSPENDPIPFDTIEDAQEALYAEAIHACDILADIYGEWSEIVARAVNAAAECGVADQVHLPTSDSEHDLGVVLWIAEATD